MKNNIIIILFAALLFTSCDRHGYGRDPLRDIRPLINITCGNIMAPYVHYLTEAILVDKYVNASLQEQIEMEYEFFYGYNMKVKDDTCVISNVHNGYPESVFIGDGNRLNTVGATMTVYFINIDTSKPKMIEMTITCTAENKYNISATDQEFNHMYESDIDYKIEELNFDVTHSKHSIDARNFDCFIIEGGVDYIENHFPEKRLAISLQFTEPVSYIPNKNISQYTRANYSSPDTYYYYNSYLNRGRYFDGMADINVKDEIGYDGFNEMVYIKFNDYYENSMTISYKGVSDDIYGHR